MAEAHFEEIYQISNAIFINRKVVRYARRSEIHQAVLTLKENIPILEKLIGECRNTGFEEADELAEALQRIFNDDIDWTLRADILESIVIPDMERYVQSLGSVNEQADDENVIESTATGFLTIKNLRTDKYLHSNNDPMDEAFQQVEHIYEPAAEEYAVLGCGLGYHIYQLYRISKGSVKLHLYEQEESMVEYARRFGVLDWIPEELLEIHIDKSVYSFLNDIVQRNMGTFMLLPYLFTIRDPMEKDTMMVTFGNWLTPYTFQVDWQINFQRNIHSAAQDLEKLDKSLFQEEIVVIGAGPSLDDNLELLRAWRGKKTLIAVGTVFRKLLRAGIRPDLVVVMDPQDQTFRQLEGCEEEDIPMLLEAGASWKFAREYKGPRYLVFTPATKEAANYVKQTKRTAWSPGGTVTSLAMEAAVFCGKAKAVYLAGVDLAYPGGFSHASDTLEYAKCDTDGMIETEGVNGEKVFTTYTFQSYLTWMEDFIACHPEVRWFNLSTRGAKLRGAEKYEEVPQKN